MSSPAATSDLRAVGALFRLRGRWTGGAPHGSGHIHDTFLATADDAGRPVRYALQRLNERVFPDLDAVTENIARVTAHLRGREDPSDGFRTLSPVAARAGGWLARDDAGAAWRAFEWIENARSVDVARTPAEAREAARAIGLFHRRLADMPARSLRETIPGFHDTPRRYEALHRAIERDAAGRLGDVRAEVAFALAREEPAGRLIAGWRAGRLPERVTHNDTKINNILFDENTGRAVCVIDMDTAMPGLALYDIGDMIRTMTSPADEDERDLSRVTFRLPFYEAILRGYREGAGDLLTAAERAELPFCGRVITLETGVRFLADFLSGDVYFKTARPGHNLDRCRTQFRLVEEMERAEGTSHSTFIIGH
jgi:Ser/Thr protein kinase RdoA (MazF antagonist)